MSADGKSIYVKCEKEHLIIITNMFKIMDFRLST
jgi:hypothetical protein